MVCICLRNAFGSLCVFFNYVCYLRRNWSDKQRSKWNNNACHKPWVPKQSGDLFFCSFLKEIFLAFFRLAFSAEKVLKRKKIKRTAIEDGEAQNNSDAGDDKSNVMPAPPPSKRQKKRQKKEQNSVRSKDKETEKTISYLNKWDLARDEWKYEKLRQIHIQKNILDESTIPDECIDVAIRYLSTSKVSTGF